MLKGAHPPDNFSASALAYTHHLRDLIRLHCALMMSYALPTIVLLLTLRVQPLLGQGT